MSTNSKTTDRGERWWQTLKRAIDGFLADEAMTQAAALAFYTALSFAPLLVVLMACLSLFLGDSAQAELINQLGAIAGPQAAEVAKQVLASNEAQPELSTWAGIIGAGVLVFSATGVFAQLQSALNTVWGVAADPSAGLWDWLKKRLLSLGLIIAVGFLLLVSLVASALIQLFLNATGLAGDGWFWVALNTAVSLLVFAGVFATMFRFLPDAKIRWRDVWQGGLMTAGLFALGKWGIGKYLGYSSVGSAYGAAGSLLVLLVWVYYSAIIVLFGAELTEAWASRNGHRVAPEEHAVAEPSEKQCERSTPSIQSPQAG